MIKPVRTVSWAVLDGAGSAALGVITFIILSRVLVPREFGTISFAQATVSLVNVVVVLGINEALVQRRPLDTLHLDSAFWAAISLGLAGFFTCCALAAILLWQGEDPVAAYVLAVEGTGCLFTGLNLLPTAMLDRKMRTRWLATRTLAGKSAYCIAAITLAALGFGVWSIVAAGIVQNLTASAILWRCQARWPARRFSWSHFRGLVSFGVPVAVEQGLWSVLGRVFYLLIGAVHGLETLGFVSLAFRATDTFGGVMQMIARRIGLPLFSSLQHDRRRFRQAFSTTSEALLLVSAPIFAGIALTAADWVPIFLGRAWVPAVPLIQVLCVVWIAASSRQFVGHCIKALGRPSALIFPAMTACVCTVLAVVATAHMSMLATIIAWAARVPVTVTITAYLLKRYAGVGYTDQLRVVVQPGICLVAMALGVIAWRHALPETQSAVARLASSAVVGSLIYAVFAAAIYRRVLRTLIKNESHVANTS